MGSRKMDCKGVLEKMLEISTAQLQLFEQKRYVELFKNQERRDRLFEALKGFGVDIINENNELKSIVDRLVENDRRLGVKVESELKDIRTQLKKLTAGTKAVKAYADSGGRRKL